MAVLCPFLPLSGAAPAGGAAPAAHHSPPHVPPHRDVASAAAAAIAKSLAASLTGGGASAASEAATASLFEERLEALLPRKKFLTADDIAAVESAILDFQVPRAVSLRIPFLTPSLTRSLDHSIAHSLAHSIDRSLARSLTPHPRVPVTRGCLECRSTRPLIRSLTTDSLARLTTHSLMHARTPPTFTRSFTRSPTHPHPPTVGASARLAAAGRRLHPADAAAGERRYGNFDIVLDYVLR